MRRGQGDVDVARLADGLAVVEGLDDREFARALLDESRDAKEVLRALRRRSSWTRPSRRRVAPAATARSTSAPEAWATVASGSSLAGLSVVELTRGADGSVNSPSMKSP